MIPTSRTLRIFISSTFRDMHGEREELVKRVFPHLRKLCEQRGVTWGEVDLRWGVTDEQKAEGQVLPICLAEIHNCRPEAFAMSRARVDIGRQEYFRQLDAHAQGDGLPLVILGESGIGKSALLANWALRYRAQHPEDLVITHSTEGTMTAR